MCHNLYMQFVYGETFFAFWMAFVFNFNFYVENSLLN